MCVLMQRAGPLEVQLLRRLDHFLFEIGDDPFLVPLEKLDQPFDVLAVRLPADLPGGARRGALLDRVEQARAKEPAAGVVFADVEVAGAEFERLLEQRHRLLQRVDAGERPVKFHPLLARLAGDVHAGELFVGRDHQVGEGLVVEQPGVVARLDVLDEPVFGQQRLDFALGLQDVEVDDVLDKARFLVLELHPTLKVAANAVAQRGRLADVDDPALVVLHQVDAGGFRQGFGFFREFVEALVHESTVNSRGFIRPDSTEGHPNAGSNLVISLTAPGDSSVTAQISSSRFSALCRSIELF